MNKYINILFLLGFLSMLLELIIATILLINDLKPNKFFIVLVGISLFLCVILIIISCRKDIYNSVRDVFNQKNNKK